MTQLEYIEANAKFEIEARENKRAHETQLELIETKHRELIQAENERYETEKRRQKAEYADKVDNLTRRVVEAKKKRAITRAEEEKSLMQS
jgi:hypothetical protein